MPSFEDASVLVAGGTGGLGRAVSLAFLEAGARVAVTFRKRDELAGLEAAAGDLDNLRSGWALARAVTPVMLRPSLRPPASGPARRRRPRRSRSRRPSRPTSRKQA